MPKIEFTVVSSDQVTVQLTEPDTQWMRCYPHDHRAKIVASMQRNQNHNILEELQLLSRSVPECST